MAYNVFISWSGEPSKTIALTLHDWIPTIVQAADPFMSDRDIDAGARGLTEIAGQLREIKIGICCVTANNQTAPWLNFEAGALSKLIDDTFVIPLAFDTESGQVKQPLGQFQAKQFTQEEMRQVAATVNRALGSQVSDHRLDVAFDRGWPELNQKIEALRTEQQIMEAFFEPSRTPEDMLEELIVSVRDQTALVKSSLIRPVRQGLMSSHLAATEATLGLLAMKFKVPSPMTPNVFLDHVSQFDAKDWALIENTPFLFWYLTELNAIEKPNILASDFDDVPF